MLRFFDAMDKALADKLSCTRSGLVSLPVRKYRRAVVFMHQHAVDVSVKIFM